VITPQVDGGGRVASTRAASGG